MESQPQYTELHIGKIHLYIKLQIMEGVVLF